MTRRAPSPTPTTPTIPKESDVADLRELETMIKDARAMAERIRNCPKHRFPASAKNYRLGESLTCLNCKGRLTLIEVGNYVRGYKAAGGDPKDVIPDWT